MTLSQADHFLFNSSLFAPKLRMMLRGIRVDQSKLEELKAEAAAGVWRLQALIDGVVAALQSHARTPEVKLLDYLYAGLNEEQFSKLCLSCLGGSNPRVRRDVTVERWQPMRWNGRKWVKDGKLLDTRPAPYEYIEQDTEPAQSDDKWLKPAHKIISRLQSFTSSTLAEVEPHVLDSKRAEWKRVKQIWKELKNDDQRTTGEIGAKALLGELSALLNLAINVGSTNEGGDSQWFLYECCGLPRIYCDAKTGRYSRETEAEWKRRTKEGVKHARRKSNRLANRTAATGNPGDSLRDQGGLGPAGADPSQSESDSAGSAAEDENGGVSHGRKTKKANRTAINPTQPDAESLGAGGQGDAVGGVDRERNSSGGGEAVLGGKGSTGAADTTDTAAKGLAEGESDGLSGASSKSSKRLSTDQIALDRLYAHTRDVRVLWVLQQRRLRKVVTDLSTKLDPDGRLRASISLVKETGRMSESAAPTGCGLNRQALNKDLLSICIPDEGYEMAKLDLEGADSWTVACEAAALGDSTMLDDLKAGIKPAQVVGLIYLNGVKVNEWPRESIKQRLTELTALPWLYPGAKATAHESPYGGGWETTQMILLKNSMADLPLDLKDAKPIALSKKQIDDLQGAFFSRYPGVKLWQQKVARQLMEKGYLATSTGHVRRFYGRKVEIKAGRRVVNHSTLREALSSMPQYYTTYSIKQAWLKMWEDVANWRECGACEGRGCYGALRCETCAGIGRLLKVEPLALKHDEILMQWRREDRGWAIDKLRQWFKTLVRIAGIEVVIPAAGKIGGNWGMKDGEKLELKL